VLWTVREDQRLLREEKRTSTEAEDNMRTRREEDQRAEKVEAGGDIEAGDRRKRKRRLSLSLRGEEKRRKGEGKIAYHKSLMYLLCFTHEI
jgi:hypothetical protein